MADDGNSKQGAPKRLETPDPAGHFEGESITRRRVFVVGGQALGAAAGAAVLLPTIGFALAPLFEVQGDDWQDVGPVSEFPKDTYKTVVITAVPGIGESGKTTAYVRRGRRGPGGGRERLRRDLHPLRAPGLPGPLRRGGQQLHLPVPRRRL